MEDISGESSQVIFDHFRKCNYDAVMDAQERIKEAIDKPEHDEENEGFMRQKQMVDALLEYYKEGAKDPKKAYKILSNIDNEDRQEPFCETNFLLEFNCGVFAYLSQMFGKAIKHFTRILNNCEDAEMFLVVKSAFNYMQILVDNQYIEAAKSLLERIEELLPCLKRVKQLKKDYKPSSEHEKRNMSSSLDNGEGLGVENFSVSTGSSLSTSAKAPKSPCIIEYEFFVTYFKTRIALHDSDEESRRKWAKKLEKQYQAMEKQKQDRIAEVEDIVKSQCYSMVPYINSFEVLQSLLPRNPRSGQFDEQDSIRVLSFMDRDKSKGGPTTHPSGFKNIKDSEKRKEQILQNCNQKHPLFFFNNLGVLHLNTKKYSMAVFFLTKALKYLTLDGKQNLSYQKNPIKFVSNHTSQKRAEIMHNLGLAFYKLKEYEKSVNCLSEACELYSSKYSIWFWMGAACIKNYVNQGAGYFMKNSTNTVLLKRPQLQEIDSKIPEKMRLNQAIRYLENVITSYENFVENEREALDNINQFDFTKIFSNIPTVCKESKQEEGKDERKEEESGSGGDKSFSQGLHNKSVQKRHYYMTKSSYLLLIYAYLILGNTDKALDYCKTLKSDFKLNSKMNFELKMYMAEIFLMRGKTDQAFKCLKIDQAFEERKDGAEDSENSVSIENTWSGFVERELPKRAVMFLNIATCNYVLDIPDATRDAIANALDSLGMGKDDNQTTKKASIVEIPEYLLHSLVYLNLYNGDEETALKLLRKRRFDKNNEDLLNFSTSLGPLKIFK